MSWIFGNAQQKNATEALHRNELTVIADIPVPAQTVLCRKRSSDQWMDIDCR